MKRLSYNYLAGDRILAPFSIDQRAITLSQDLPASLAKLFPIKAVFFSQKDPGIFSVSLVPNTPYGPAIDILIDFFFSDFHRALAEVKDFFGLQRIELISPDNRFKDREEKWSSYITKRHETGILLNLFEFYRLYTAAIHKQHIENVLLSIFLDEHTIFCLQVPEGIPIQNILLLLQTEYYIELSSKNTPFHPMLRRSIDPEKETTGHHTSLIMFTHSGYTIAPTGNFFLEFPYFYQIIGIRKGEIFEKRSVPCNNCLACSNYCPSGLFPNVLYHKSITGKKDKTVALNIKACIQCGTCNFVCPANLPLCETITQTIHDIEKE
jgi:ferredoxin